MTGWEALAVALAGLAAGTINTVVGSGTLITFPVLLAVGYPPVLANVSNTVGLVPGSVERRDRLPAPSWPGRAAGWCGSAARRSSARSSGPRRCCCAPERAFQAVVPVLIALACVLVVVQPRLSGWLARRGRAPRAHGGPLLYAGVLGAGVYGGYFGAAQGVLLIALLGLLLDDDLQRVNAAKNVLAGLVNLVAAVVFIAVTDVAWEAAGLIALGAVVGGQVGATIGRRVPAPVLRGLVVLVGVVAIVALVVD